MSVPARTCAALAPTVLVALVLLMVPSGAVAHGDEVGSEATSVAAEIEQLSIQPARVLAQQALASLVVLGDAHEAGIRLDAALKSEDKSDIDVEGLRQATETLDGGDPEGAIPLLDEALSRPPGSSEVDPLHAAGREFRPAFATAEVVGIILGALLLLIGGGALWRGHDRRGVTELKS